jgi:hypothetical protein
MILSAFLDGCKRTVSAPAILLGTFVVTVALTLPLALTLRGMLEGHLGKSLAADRAADAVNYDWWEEFRAQAAGLGTTFTPSVIGFAAVLDNVSNIVDARGQIASVAGAAGAFLLVWTFLSGGIIDRYARQRPTRAHGFFAAAGVFFFRFLRLAAVAGFAYWILFAVVHRQLFDEWLPYATRDVSVERSAFLWRLGAYLLFGGLLALVNVWLDYAKIRAVVEDRRSMLVALLASARFIIRNPARVFALYLVNSLLFAAVIALWALVAPGAGGSGASIWVGFLAAQVYVLARLFVKLEFVASQTSLFQASLAHVAYTAAPVPTWPEPPAAEVIASR